MINILIVDDSTEKTSIITNFLVQECNIPIGNIKTKQNIKEAKITMYEEDFELLLLDLVLPRDSETEPNAEESIKFLSEIYYNSSIHIPAYIIGFSQFDNLIDIHNESFEDKLWHLINFSFSNNSWKDKLNSKICYIISLKQRFRESIEAKNQYDLAIICALETPEFKEVLNTDLDWEMIQFENDPLVYYKSIFNTINGNSYKVIACAINRMGMQATASVSTKLIEVFRVKQIFMTGICAGIKDRNINFGDIIISESITDYGSGKMIENENNEVVLKPEPHQIPTDQSILSKMNNFLRDPQHILKIQANYNGNKPNTLIKAEIGPTTSGSYVVSSESVVKNITSQNRKLLSIDMEGYGMYLAAHFSSNTKPLMIKSVCDFGDSEKGDDYQNYASYTSANFLYSFIFNML